MILDSILTHDRSLCNLELSSKKKVFEFIADFLSSSSDTPLKQPDQLIELLNTRERLGTTAIGKGIAVPHCRCPKIDEPLGLLITLDKAIAFDALDGQKVDIIFVLMVPEKNHEQYLSMLTSLAELFDSIDFRNQVRKAESSEELFYAALNFERLHEHES